MAGGPFLPSSVEFGSSGELFPNKHVGAGGGAPNAAPTEEGLGVANATDLTADRVIGLYFEMPTTLPTGTPKLRLRAKANLEAGDLSVDPSVASVAMDEDPSAATLTALGPDPDSRVGGDGSDGDNSTFGWATGDDDKYIVAFWIPTGGNVPVAGEMYLVALRIDDGDSDHAADVTLNAAILYVD